jgi:multicomponent Na+:H+ antiporter subunit E
MLPENRRAGTILGRLAVFAVVWWAVAEGDLAGWGFAVPGVALFAWASLGLHPMRRWRLAPWLRFAMFFLWESVLGAIAVARHAYSRRIDVPSTFVPYRSALPPEREHVLLANTITLLPGTMTCRLVEDGLTIHVLDDVAEAMSTVRDAEARIGRVFP